MIKLYSFILITAEHVLWGAEHSQKTEVKFRLWQLSLSQDQVQILSKLQIMIFNNSNSKIIKLQRKKDNNIFKELQVLVKLINVKSIQIITS